MMRPARWIKSVLSSCRNTKLPGLSALASKPASSHRRSAKTVRSEAAEYLEDRSLLTPMVTASGDLNLSSSDTFEVEIEGATAGTEHDQTDVTGSVSLGNASLDLQVISAATVGFGDALIIIDNDGSDAVSGTFSGLVEGASVDVGGRTSTISYVGGDGNDVVITVGAFIVDLTSDEADGDLSSGDVSLRDAVIAANAAGGTADQISVSIGTYTLSLAGRLENAAATGDLDITQDVSIIGGSSDASQTVIDADSIDRVFDIADAGLTVRLENLTVTGGNATDDGLTTDSGEGGGLLVDDASLTLVNVAITDNTATDRGGALLARGAAFPLSAGVTLSGNMAAGVADNQFRLDVISTVNLTAGAGPAVVSVGTDLSVVQNGVTLLQLPLADFVRLEINGTNDAAGDSVVIVSNAASSVSESILVTADSSGDLSVSSHDEYLSIDRNGDTIDVATTSSSVETLPDIVLSGIEDVTVNTRGGHDSVLVENLDSLTTPLTRAVFLLGAGADTFSADEAYAGSSGSGLIVVGNGGRDTIVGSIRDDLILGGTSNDNLSGLEGDDTLNGQAGKDIVFGDEGNDRMVGGGGADDLVGGDGDDFANGQSGNDTLRGGVGIDTLLGGSGRTVVHDTIDADVVLGRNGFSTSRGDTVTASRLAFAIIGGGASNNRFESQSTVTQVRFIGGDGDDTLIGTSLADTLEGGNGNDSLVGNLGDDALFGDDGNDTLRGQTGDDRLSGGADDDLLDGGNGRNSLYEEVDADLTLSGSGSSVTLSGAGNDTLSGSFNSAVLIGGSSANTIDASGFGGPTTLLGEGGADTITGTDFNDVIDGGAGNDSLSGGRGLDVINGGSGGDVIDGGNDADTLLGGGGNDSISGGAGTDRLLGEEGDDTLDGDSGTDRIAGGGNGIAASGSDQIIDDVFLNRETLLFNFDRLLRDL